MWSSGAVAGISFDRAAETYDVTRGLPPPIMDASVDALARVLAGRRVLEVGVGTGRFALPLRDRGIRVVGLDISRNMIAKARAKGGASPAPRVRDADSVRGPRV